MTNPTLSAGGIFTADVSGHLTFFGLSTLTLQNTVFPFVVHLGASGYIAAGEWNPVPGANITSTKLHYSVTTDYAVTVKGLSLTNINGGNLAIKPVSGVATGFLVTITLLFG
jgi:hypothetical protein